MRGRASRRRASRWPDDYREFVRAWLAKHRTRTQRGLARRLGLAHSFVSMMLRGKRQLQLADAERWAEAMRLDGPEGELFVALVEREHGPTEQGRKRAACRARVLRGILDGWSTLTRAQLRRVLTPPGPAVLGLARCADFRPDPEWIRSRLVDPAKDEILVTLLEFLIGVGVLFEDEDGAWRVDERPIATSFHHGELDDTIRALHQAHLERSLQALDAPAGTRHVGLTFASVPARRLPELYDELTRAVLGVVEAYRAEPGEEVVQIGLQAVRVTK